MTAQSKSPNPAADRAEADLAYNLGQEISQLLGDVPFGIASAAIAAALAMGLRELCPRHREMVLNEVVSTTRRCILSLDELHGATKQ